MVIKSKAHQIFEFAKEFKNLEKDKLILIDNKLCLKEDILEAVYESNPIEILPSRKVVASWGAITSVDATIEILVSLMVEGAWSNFVSYGEWGFGRRNGSHYQSDELMKLAEDEMIILNDKLATAIKYRVILRRRDLCVDSPRFNFITFALDIPDYSYPVDISSLPCSVKHDVPRLCQLVVPEIGNSICSPTTITMMLKYRGLNFSEYDEFEHRYIALKSRDYGNEIFGNWVYCTVAAASFDKVAYVARMYSMEELLVHLQNGPVALSVKGRMLSNEKDYTTKGHLMLAVGYKYVDGKLYILCNDPNVNNVYCEYSEDVIKETWRFMSYVMND